MTLSSAIAVRPYAVTDAPDLWEAARESMHDLRPWMPWCHPGYSVDDAASWLETQVRAFEQGTSFEFAIVSPTGRYLGGGGLNQIDEANRRANLGYWVRSSATGRGVATAAVQRLQEWGFAHQALVRLEIVIANGNLASIRVAEKAGAIREGTLRSRLLLHGRPHDAALFSFVREHARGEPVPDGAPFA